MNDEFLSTLETSKILNVSDWTVRQLIKSGQLKASKAGRSYVILKSDLDHYRQTPKTRLTVDQVDALKAILAQEDALLSVAPDLLAAFQTLKKIV